MTTLTPSLDEISQALLAQAKAHGAEAGDALVVQSDSVSIDVREGALEQAERSEGVDIGLRVFLGQRQAIVSSSDVSAETMSTMAERAVAMAREAPEDPFVGLADASQFARSWDSDALELTDPGEEPTPEHLKETALAAEAAAASIKGVSQVQQASAAFGRKTFVLAGSNGFSGGYARSNCGHSVVAISGTGTRMERDYSGDSRIYRSDLRDPNEIGREAGERAVARAGARKPPTGSYPVLFDERIASSLVGHVFAAINGTSIARGASWLRDAMGEQVLPKGLHLTEDPLRPRVGGSRPFDGEGLPTQARHWIEDGMLTGWVLDLATARKLGMRSTGNAARGTSGGPSPSISNVTLTQGDRSRDDLLKDMGTGLLVTAMIGATINPNTGDYSRGASGHWVENGEIAYPVNECTIASNLRDMLREIVPANDARPWVSRVVPSLLVPGMTLAGA